jgi:hypothetical protein
MSDRFKRFDDSVQVGWRSRIVLRFRYRPSPHVRGSGREGKPTLDVCTAALTNAEIAAHIDDAAFPHQSALLL